MEVMGVLGFGSCPGNRCPAGATLRLHARAVKRITESEEPLPDAIRGPRPGPRDRGARGMMLLMDLPTDTALLVKALGAFFAIMNPFVNLPLFLGLTAGQEAAQQRRTAWRTVVLSAIMCAVVAVAGSTLLRFFDITVDDFRVAGGLVLLMIALGMLSGRGASAHEGTSAERDRATERAGGADVSFYPMTFPILVGPGTIATIIVIQSQAQGLGGHAAVAAALAAVLAALGIVLYFSASIGARLSMTMRTIMTRLMGMILASIAVQMIVVGIQHLFPGLAR